ncbi:ATP-binding protein [Crocosphaera sp.]|uniref:PAS domain-containing sensor histidine kinase n=1 Tax=Crocosphaera sp. TaxID=2729996 RepID=UPI003F272C57|nr:ATP-binding protein [Crocosphaera sp.]
MTSSHSSYSNLSEAATFSQVLKRVLLGVSSPNTENFFASLVLHLTQALGVEYGFITELKSEKFIQVLAGCVNGQPSENINYSLEQTPCQKAIQQGIFSCSKNIRQQFPDDTWLQENKIESYIGKAIYDQKGNVLGLLCLMSVHALPNLELMVEIVDIFALNVAREWEKQKAEQQLKEINKKLEKFVADRTHKLEEVNQDLRQEIQERKEIEKQLIKREKKLHHLVYNLATGIIIVDQQGMIKFANPTALEIFNQPLNSLLGYYFGIPIVSQKPAILEILKPENKTGVVEMHVSVTEWEQKSVYLVSLRDITEEKALEIAKEKSEEKFHQLIENIQEVFALTCLESRTLLYISPTCEKIWGLSAQLLYEKPDLLHSSIYEEDRSKVVRSLLDQHQGESTETEYRIIDNNNNIHWLRVCSFPVQNKEEEIYRIATLYEDITDRKNAEIELIKAKKAADSANQAKSDFLTTISHEIRNPINTILGFCELLKSNLSHPQLHQYADAIYSGGNTLLVLINDLLDLAKIEAGKLELNYQPVDLQQIIAEIIQFFSYEASQKKLSILIDISENTPKTINFEPLRLQQILFNLLGNAIKFTDQGYVKIIVMIDNLQEDQCTIILKVQDTGIGIKDTEKEKIFQKFIQSEGQDISRYGGTGLGLSITEKLTHLLGGKITLESQWQKGTIFHLTFPDVEIIDLRENTNIELTKELSDSSQLMRKKSDHEEIENLCELLKKLADIEVNSWRLIRKTMILSQLKQFSHNLQQLGHNHNCQLLLNYSQTLADYLQTFELEKLAETLEKFPQLKVTLDSYHSEDQGIETLGNVEKTLL